MEVKNLITDEQIVATFPVMGQLRPHLEESNYLDTVRRMEKSDGYRLAAVLEDGQARCVAGYRVMELLAYGKALYVDDLVTDEAARSRDFGKQMLGWLAEEASRNGCKKLHLDSGVHRPGAHRFYFREGLEISSYHFIKDL
ncbi:MAG: GNAT family N-acetyltransferase [Rubrobacteraceae bacterium]